jgi:hypothetical protein
VPRKKLAKAAKVLTRLGEPFHEIGRVVKASRGKGRVIYK